MGRNKLEDADKKKMRWFRETDDICDMIEKKVKGKNFSAKIRTIIYHYFGIKNE